MKKSINSAVIRCAAVFCVIILALTLLSVRIYFIGQNGDYINAAKEQGTFKVTVANTIGTVYDRNFQPLTNCQTVFAAATAIPSDFSGYIDTLKEIAENYSEIEDNVLGGKPFTFTATKEYNGNGVISFPVKTGSTDCATHILGYFTENDGTGLLKGYKDILDKYSGEISVTYTVNAVGRNLEGESTEIVDTTVNSVGGLVTTLDAGIQEAAQKALDGVTGAAVVMNVNGDIAAICSSPTYDVNNLVQAVANSESPMLNRALQSYNVGSVFKICISAAAIEAGIDDFVYECQGSIDIHGKEIGCHKSSGHGLMNIQTALVNSCNPYFIALGQRLGSTAILEMAEKMSFGQEIYLAEGIISKAGILPTESELSPPAALANLSIGQGTLLASPIQVAVAVNCVATGGLRVVPRLVKGETADGSTLYTETEVEEGQRIFSIETANALKCNMEKVFSDGSVKNYAPEKYTAAGKTSTAQTGIIGEDGNTICQTWLAGFYPAQQPKYTIVVLVENGSSGAKTAGPIFKEITDYIGENCI